MGACEDVSEWGNELHSTFRSSLLGAWNFANTKKSSTSPQTTDAGLRLFSNSPHHNNANKVAFQNSQDAAV